jgi:hypothetical protein
MRATMRLDVLGIAIPSECRQLVSGCTPDHALQRPSWHLRELADGVDAALVEPRLGRRTNAPHQLDREIMKETKLALRVDNHEAVRFGHLRGNLREMFGACHSDRDRETKFGPHAATDCGRNLSRRTE